MALEIVILPCLADNYAYLIRNTTSGETALIDAPEAAPILAALQARGWHLDSLLLTHHHDDHIAGTTQLRAAFPALRVLGAKADAHRLPPLDQPLSPGQTLTLCGEPMQVLEVSGHTIGHLAFHLPQTGAVFTADSLMTLGCGRLFEGTPAQMWDSLQRLAALPPQTLIYSGHDYAQSNARFALTIEPDNPTLIERVAAIEAARLARQPAVPVRLSLELATNPFLRASLPALKARLQMPQASDVDTFAHIRALKDRF